MASPEPRWRVRLRADPLSIQHWSIWCGLAELHAQGVVDLSLSTASAPQGTGMWLDVNDRESRQAKSVWVDVSDRTPARSGRRDAADSSWIRNGPQGVGRPLGFVAPMRSGRQSLRKYVAASVAASIVARRPRDARRALAALREGTPLQVGAFEARAGGSPRVLFQVRAWEPDDGSDPADRRRVNDVRAALIRGLHAEFGSRFVGGFFPRPYAIATYPSLVSTLPVERRAYLSQIRDSAIVVSSTGLHGSIPWKLAEYCAASRAIVSERITNALPWNLDDTLSWFDDPSECVAECVRLIGDSEALRSRQLAARHLWDVEVRPDRLVHAHLLGDFSA